MLSYSCSTRFLIPLLLLPALWTGCSRDPEAQKLHYLRDGERYLNGGKYAEAVIQFRNAIEIDRRYAPAHFQLGKAYVAMRNADGAFRAFQEAATLDPHNLDAHIQLAQVMLSKHMAKQALAIANTVLTAEPRNVEGHALLGEVFTLTREFDKAVQEFKTVTELDPKRVENHLILGAAYGAAGKTVDAQRTLENAVLENPSSVPARVSLAQFYFSSGNLAKAESAMLAAASLDRTAIAPRVFLGRIYVRAGRWADAERVYIELKAGAPDNPEAYRSLAGFYLSTGQRDKALVELQALSKSKPKDTQVRADLVEILLDLGRLDEARALNQSLFSSDGDLRARIAAGRILLARGKAQEAANLLQKVVNTDSSSASGFYLLGKAQTSLGLMDAARRSFTRALELQPQMMEASAALAAFKVQSEEHREATRLADKATQSDPGLAWPFIVRARSLMEEGENQAAAGMIQEALRRDPASLPALTALMTLGIKQGKPQDAIQHVSAVAQQNPNVAGLRFLLAMGYFELKNLDKSETNLREAIRLDPKTASAYSLMARIDLARGLAEKAKADLQSAILANPHNVANYMSLVRIHEKEKNWEEAKKLCERARETDPHAPLVAAELAFLYLEHGGDLNLAVSLAQSAKQKLPDSPITADALGWAYYKLGSPSLAVKELKEAADKIPGNPMYQYHLGAACIAAKNMELARRSLEAALHSGVDFPDANNARHALDNLH